MKIMYVFAPEKKGASIVLRPRKLLPSLLRRKIKNNSLRLPLWSNYGIAMTRTFLDNAFPQQTCAQACSLRLMRIER